MRPTSCPKCERRFLANRTLQAEVRHIAAKEGESAARLDLDERLREFHDGGHR